MMMTVCQGIAGRKVKDRMNINRRRRK